jgi:hypothetical protein
VRSAHPHVSSLRPGRLRSVDRKAIGEVCDNNPTPRLKRMRIEEEETKIIAPLLEMSGWRRRRKTTTKG